MTQNQKKPAVSADGSPTPNDLPVRYDLAEVAILLRTSVRTLRYRIDQGLLSVIYEGDKIYVTRAEVLRYGKLSHPQPVTGKPKTEPPTIAA
jgi:hypothetical protein